MSETLNISQNIKTLLIKALNKHTTLIQSAKELGVSYPRLSRMIEEHNIKKDRVTKKYFTPPTSITK